MMQGLSLNVVILVSTLIRYYNDFSDWNVCFYALGTWAEERSLACDLSM